MPIRLWYEPNGTAHDDLFFRLVETTRTADSYYFALDDHLPGRGDEVKVCAVLAVLLGHWETALVGLDEGEVAYLPFGFLDQCIACVECRRNGDAFEVREGYTAGYEGHSVYPSDPGILIRGEGRFQPSGVGPVRLEAEAVLASVRWSVDRAMRLDPLNGSREV